MIFGLCHAIGLRTFRRGFLPAFVALVLLQTQFTTAAEKPSLDELLTQAKAAFTKGDREEGLRLVTQAVQTNPKNPRAYFARAWFYEGNHEAVKALADYNELLKLDPSIAEAWTHRGGEHFKLGHIKESIADFKKYIELVPQQAPYHWQLGIAYYYAGQFENGRKQFELHQTVNSNDVENAVWHFLCVARANGIEQARKTLIPIKSDARIPMMQVHALFAGKAQPEDVLKTASDEKKSKTQLDRQLFYAHLYLGLYFEAAGDDSKAHDHITKAAGQYRPKDYMGDVAEVHLQLRWPRNNSTPSANKND